MNLSHNNTQDFKLDDIVFATKGRTKYNTNEKFVSNYLDEVKPWYKLDIKKITNIEFYSKPLIEYIEKIWQLSKIYLSRRNINQSLKSDNVQLHKIKRFAKVMYTEGDFIAAFYQMNGLHGEMGLEYTRSQLKISLNETGELPISSMPGMRIYSQAVHRGFWKDYGINRYYDLITSTFESSLLGNYILNEQLRNYDFVREYIMKYYKKNGRPPRYEDEKMGTIHLNCKFGYYEGISTFDELIREIFGSSNKSYYNIDPPLSYENATSLMMKFFDHNGRQPTTNDKEMLPIIRSIRHGEYKQQDVESYNALILKVFRISNKSFYSHKIYNGQEGLEQAQKEALDQFETTDIIPRWDDPKISKIYKAIYRGEWRSLGVSTWKYFIELTFNVTLENKYLGYNGLNTAINETKIFQEKNKRLPKWDDPEMSSIYYNIHNKTWEEFGILTFTDFIKHIFGKSNQGGAKKPLPIHIKNFIISEIKDGLNKKQTKGETQLRVMGNLREKNYKIHRSTFHNYYKKTLDIFHEKNNKDNSKSL